MIRAWRESPARRLATMVRTAAPLTAPDSTSAPEAIWLARQKWLVHAAVALNHVPVGGASFVRVNRQHVSRANVFSMHVGNARFLLRVGDRGRSLGALVQRGRRAPHRKRFQRFAARKHEHNDRARQVFAKDGGTDDRYPRQQVGSPSPTKQLDQERQAPPSSARNKGTFRGVSGTSNRYRTRDVRGSRSEDWRHGQTYQHHEARGYGNGRVLLGGLLRPRLGTFHGVIGMRVAAGGMCQLVANPQRPATLERETVAHNQVAVMRPAGP